MTYAVYEFKLASTKDCVHGEPNDYYVGSTHVSPDHPATERVREHKAGINSKVLASGYRIGASRVVRDGYPSRDAAEDAEGRHAARLRKRGYKVWCDK